MSITTILTVVMIGIMVICAWQGFKKGIIMGIIEVLVIILSIYGAQLLSDAYSYEVIPALKPFIAGYVEPRVEKQAYELLGYEADENGNYDVVYSLRDLLEENPEVKHSVYLQSYRSLGIYTTAADAMADKAEAYAEDNQASLTEAAVEVLCQTVTWVAGFLIGFILIFVVLTVIVNLPNLSFRIPFVGLVNDLGGIALGLVSGALFCSLVLWFMQYAGLLLSEQTLRSSDAAAFFMDMNLLSQFINF